MQKEFDEMFAIFTTQAQNGAEQLKADIQNRVGNYPAVLRLARHNDCKNDKIFAQLKIFQVSSNVLLLTSTQRPTLIVT